MLRRRSAGLILMCISPFQTWVFVRSLSTFQISRASPNASVAPIRWRTSNSGSLSGFPQLRGVPFREQRLGVGRRGGHTCVMAYPFFTPGGIRPVCVPFSARAAADPPQTLNKYLLSGSTSCRFHKDVTADPNSFSPSGTFLIDTMYPSYLHTL